MIVEIKNEILKEIQAISSVLASIPKKNCFKMPENYLDGEFEQNHQTEMIVDKLDFLKKNAFKIPQNLDTSLIVDGVKAHLVASKFPNLNQTFKVPKNYFEELGDRLSFITNEEEETVNLNVPNIKYSVPSGYFENLTNVILAKVDAPQDEKLNPLFEQMRHEQIFKVPAAYFETLTNEVIENTETNLSLESVEEVVGKAHNFKVPVAYFDGLYSRLNRKIKQKSTKTSTQNWKQMVSVLSLCALFVLGIWFTNGITNGSSFEDQIAALSNEEIELFITENETEFNEFLLSEFNEADYNFDLLQNAEITDEDIEQFLIEVDETFINSL